MKLVWDVGSKRKLSLGFNMSLMLL